MGFEYSLEFYITIEPNGSIPSMGFGYSMEAHGTMELNSDG
jgi:hypothetical protein